MPPWPKVSCSCGERAHDIAIAESRSTDDRRAGAGPLDIGAMGQTIELTASDGATISAYRADPDGTPKGGVVVVQEIFGVNDHIRSVADGYAADGYLAVAPAFFDRVRGGVELGYDAEGIDVGRKIAFDRSHGGPGHG